ncbi:hypothetical protein EJ02DRAFT_438294 [Clathrospora elynae]|uniref:Uncharacterized protein n=1 Tax=Clathrospora elynae TaxID=706981 RepID=A0A6A5S873_9PLEO|nr:hypothetical protein EJ02DRAFT_438294 [Clathrospora elynae]
MAEDKLVFNLPVPDKVLRELAKNVAKMLPKFAEREPAIGVKELHEILAPVLETADLPDLENTHRAAASNALCAIVEHCGASNADYIREAILDDAIWIRIFNIYLQRSGDAKGKSMRQMLLVLTAVITKDQSPRAIELSRQATTSFLDIICEREDRVKVKPALQGLAHFLLRDVVSVSQLVALHNDLLERSSTASLGSVTSQTMFKTFLYWIVYHDTALSAGHLVKNFLIQARRLPYYGARIDSDIVSPLWIEPVLQMLHDWPDRIQEFRTHVFPHCFLPNIHEYTQFLSYLHFEAHVQPKGALPESFSSSNKVSVHLDGPEEFRILLAAIATGKELGIIRDSDHRVQSNIQIQDGAIYLPDDIPGTWMSDPEPEVRLAGMFLSVYSTSVTRAINGGVLQALKRNLVHLHTDTDADFRRGIHEYTQKLFDRLRSSTATLAKVKSIHGTSIQTRLAFPKANSTLEAYLVTPSKQDPLHESLAFVVWYVGFLEEELRPTASYQSRITALRSLIIVLRSGVDPGVPFTYLSKSAQGQLNWAHGLQLGSTSLIRALLDLILDPFDDVRDSAVSVLQLCLIALPKPQKEAALAMIPRFIARAEAAMLRTGRADQADGVARAYGMVFSLLGEDPAPLSDTCFSSKLGMFEHLRTQLQETLSLAHRDLSEAVNGRPVHGTFAAIRYIVDQQDFYPSISSTSPKVLAKWIQLHEDIVRSIESLWSCVYHVLCADAPEGHVPDELEDEASLDTKEILSYSWRGLKEASVLLRSIISKAPIGHNGRDLLNPELFETLGRLCFIQLLELRHRGAHSTVSQTFAAFCRRCVSSDIAALRALPEMWYQETLRSMQDKASAITRRSAGIPAAMSALLAAEPPGGKLFSQAMKDLVAETLVEAHSANIEESRLPQVHALNCIKEIFTTSKLSVASEAYIGQGLELAAKTLNSPIWPLRNCSLMLFKALIERLLGSSEAQDWKERERAKTSRFSYDNYPSLVNILSELLDPNGPLKQSVKGISKSSSPLDLHGAEGVFPALQILRQARPPGDISYIQGLVRRLFSSPHWHLREMAARTYVSLRSTNEMYGAILSILDTVIGEHNGQHGRLLAVKYLVKKLLRDPTQFPTQRFASLMQKLVESTQRWYVASDCPFVRAAFLDIVSLCGMTVLRRTDTVSILHAWEALTFSVSIGPQYNLCLSNTYGDDLLQTSLAQAFVIDRTIMRVNALGLMVSEDYEGIGATLILLATEDPDSCCAALQTLDTIVHLKASEGLTIPQSLVLAHIHRVVLEARDAEVISEAQGVLANALTDNALKDDFFSLITDDQVLSTLTKLEIQCLNGPPSNQETALRLLGFFLDFAYQSHPEHRETVLKATARYIRLLSMTILPTNPFDARFAAIQSLSAISHIFTCSTTFKGTGKLILEFSFLLYDLLNDDDNEIRDLAARVTGTLLRAQRQSQSENTVPILTARHLVTFLASAFGFERDGAADLADKAIRRLTNTPFNKGLFAKRFEETMQEEMREDNALFAQEKQNQYKDDAADVALWQSVLRLIPASLIPADLTKGSRIWVLDGVALLIETAEREIDGALGWSSKPGMFALGMRVLCTVEVVLDWGDEDFTIKFRNGIVDALRRFADKGAKAGVHGMWLRKVETMLSMEDEETVAKIKAGPPVL